MKIHKVSLNNNIELLEYFISNLGIASQSFRYFNHRPISVIQNHLATFLLINNNIPVAYGHLDKEGKNIWLGVCVMPEHSGKGYGKVMMKKLLDEARNLNLSQIILTVDKDNYKAINMYEKFNFFKIEEEKYCYKYQYEL